MDISGLHSWPRNIFLLPSTKDHEMEKKTLKKTNNKEMKSETRLGDTEFVVLTAVTVKEFHVVGLTQFSQVEVHRRFRGKYRLHLQRRKANESRNQKYADGKQRRLSRAGFLLGLLFDSVYGGRRYAPPPKCRLPFFGLHGIICQKIELFTSKETIKE
jgi:hypothetical protein